MNDIHAAAERLRKPYEEAYGSLDDDDEWYFSSACMKDMEAVSQWGLELLDSTPLSELTDEQWLGLGFYVCDTGVETLVWSLGDVDFFVQFNLVRYRSEVFPAKTLGQLHHLLAALGWEQ